MGASPEDPAPRSRQALPLQSVIAPLRTALEAMGDAQRRSEDALRKVLESIEQVVAEPRTSATGESRVPSEAAADPPTEAAPPRSPRYIPMPPPEVANSERRVHEHPTARVVPPARDADEAPAPQETPGVATAELPELPTEAPSDDPESAVDAALSERIPPEVERADPAPEAPPVPEPGKERDDAGARSDDNAAVRRRLLYLQKALNDLDRLTSADDVCAHLWSEVKRRKLRGMLLQEKGRSVHAEAAEGFVNFEGDRRPRLKKVVVPFDPDGLLGAVAQEFSVYSGPRPARGLPVDLVLVMGKQAPAWCLVVPLPYRNRWGRFLYVDGPSGQLDELLELELVARAAVLQLRASRHRPHQPADKVRGFLLSTLHDRKRKRARRAAVEAKSEPAASKPPAGADPLSRRMRDAEPAGEPLLQTPDPERFDADGNLMHPIDGAAILSRIGELPTMPNVAVRLIGMLNDPETTIAALQEVISTDQALSVRLLQIANSSLYANMREASTIGEAVMRLGFTAIRSWLLATVTRNVFLREDATVHLHRLWRQSVIAAMAAQLVAERTGKMEPESAFVGGLMQNIGQLLVARNHPEAFDEIHDRACADMVSYFHVERKLLGFDHADLGAMILQRWGLFDELVDAIAAHHRLGAAGSASEFAAIVALAEELALRVGEGPTEASDEDLSLTPGALHLQIDADALEEIAEQLARMILDRSLFAG